MQTACLYIFVFLSGFPITPVMPGDFSKYDQWFGRSYHQLGWQLWLMLDVSNVARDFVNILESVIGYS